MGSASVDFQLNDDGTATGTISNVVDKAGKPTTFKAPPTWTPSDPTVLQCTPAADGMTCLVTPLQVGTGVTIAVVGDNITETSQAIDVIAGAVSGFQVSLQ